ncbi:hypothetical protein RJZ56_002931 [Blastomyces dermatitidis]
MRSSIACSRCRRSKIKCVNAGIDTTCRACESSGRECAYPTPAPAGGGGGTKRDIVATGDGDDRNGEWDSPKRQRSRKSTNAAPAGAKDVIKPTAAHVLDSSILTVKVWESLFELFQLHFSTILPFLHPSTFLAQIRQLSTNSAQQDGQPSGDHSQSPVPASEASPLILLGVLTLTARFHPQLTHYHSPPSPVAPCNPLVASDFFANALRSRLAGIDGVDLTSTDISRVQALLMLSLHEWGMCRGKNAWVYLGMSIRLAQVMGLAFEPESDQQSSHKTSSSGLFNAEVEQRDQRDRNSDDVIEQETRRRTLWSCLMLDRYLSNGKYRPRMIKVQDIEIQLPSDNAFAFGERVKTSRLYDGPKLRSQSYEQRGLQIPSLRHSTGYGEDSKLRTSGPSDLKQWSSTSQRNEVTENGIDRWEVGAEECVLSRLIRMVRIWGSIAKWSSSGNRRIDQYPPWHPDSRFSSLRQLLVEFQDGLSRNLQYTQRNTDTHIMYKNNLAPYSLIHILYFLSVIVLHRAYLPFLPLRCADPQGPLDEPCFPSDKYLVPEGFWRESARDLFKAARQLMELVKMCEERGVLMETPMVGFAIYNAALLGIYAAHFNQMDQEGYICSKPGSTDVVPGLGCQGQIDVRRAIEILGEMRPRLKMATGWFRTIHRVHGYFSRARRDFKRSSRHLDMLGAGPGPENDLRTSNGRPYGVREMGHAGSFDELKLLDKVLLDLGNAEDQVADINGPDEDGTTASANLVERGGAASEVGSTAVKSESADGLDSHADGVAGARRESWVPVNSLNSPVHGPPQPPPSSGSEHDRPRPLENDRWTSLPPPQPQSYPLPSLQPPHSIPSSTASHNPPPSLTSPGSYASSTPSTTAPPTNPQQLPAPSNRLQPLQPWITSRQPAPAPYSQSLPSINAAAHHGFPMPPLPGALPFHLNPPRLDAPSRPYSAGSGKNIGSGTGSSSPGWMSCLGGDDVLMFIEGTSQDQWPSSVAGSRGLANGWLSTVWCEQGQ